MNDILLILSLVLLITPPLFGSFFARYLRVARYLALTAFCYIIYTILFVLIPSAFSHLGYIALLIPPAGFFITQAAEHRLMGSLSRFSWVLLVMVLLFFLSHAVIDGASLFLASNHHGTHHSHHALGYSILLHRFVAIHIFWVALKPRLPLSFLYSCLAAICAGTLAGYFYSHEILGSFPNSHAVLEAFVAGSLLHFNFGILRRRSS